MWFVFALATTLIWGTAELFYKRELDLMSNILT